MNATVTSTGGVTAARAVTAEICLDLRRGEFLDQSFERRIVPLDARDRRWTRELVYGMLRQRAGIDAILWNDVSCERHPAAAIRIARERIVDKSRRTGQVARPHRLSGDLRKKRSGLA